MESRTAAHGSCMGSLSPARPLHLVSGLKLLAVGEGGGEDRPAPGGHAEPMSGIQRRGLTDTADLQEELALSALEGPSLGPRGSCRWPGRSAGAALTTGEAPPPQHCLASAFPSPPDSLVLNPNPEPESKDSSRRDGSNLAGYSSPETHKPANQGPPG